MSAADARGRQASLAEQASRWVVRRSGQPLAPEAQAEFDAWYQADIRHAEAYDRLARIWRRMGDIDQARLAKRPARGRKATVAALLIAATAWPVWQFSRDAHPGADYASGNALRVVELPDGSSVTLDAESAIALDYAAGKRVVRLLAGRALFEAALPRKVAPPSPSPRPMHQPRRWARAIPWSARSMAPASRSTNTACKCIAGSAPTIAPTSWTAATASRSRPTASSASPRQAKRRRTGAKACSRSTMWRCRRRRRNCPATPASACWCWGSRAQCAHLRHRAPGRPETRAGTAARADPRADHRPAGTAAAALTATTGMRRPICRLPIGK